MKMEKEKAENPVYLRFFERIEIQTRSLYHSSNKFHFSNCEITMNAQTNTILTMLYSKANPKNVEGMKRFGIKSTNNVLGVSAKPLFALAKQIGTNQELALELWKTGIYDARLLSTLIADPKQNKKEYNECLGKGL
jgi:hypothetical protein